MSKFNSKKIQSHGFNFDSKVEAEYYERLLQGNFDDVRVHPVYELVPKFTRLGNNYRAITLEADFEYTQGGRTIIVDIKGMATETAKLKRKLFAYFHPDKDLYRIVRYNKERVVYEDNEKRKRDNKKAKKEILDSTSTPC